MKFVRSYFEFTINSSILWILSNSVVKSIKIIIIINVLDRNIRIFILFFIKHCFFLSLRFRFDLSKNFQNDFNDVRTTKFVSSVIYQIINRMFVALFFVSIFDFVTLKDVFRISNLFFEIIRFIQNLEQIIFAFVFLFNLVFSSKFQISLSIFNAIDVCR